MAPQSSTRSALKPVPKAAFKLMNATLPLFVLHLQSADAEGVVAGVRARFAEDPDFFQETPLVFSLARLDPEVVPDFVMLCEGLRAIGLRPIGVMDASDAQRMSALACGLARFEDRVAKTRESEPLELVETAPAPEPSEPGQAQLALESAPVAVQRAADAKVGVPQGLPSVAGETAISAVEPVVAASAGRRPALVIDKPVRTGQRIYADGRDLIVLAMVSAGAELIADGDIHVYAPLRGRALAGARGDEGARIYTQCMAAELVSIAGNFKVIEDVSPKLMGKPAQVRLDGERVVVSALGD
jgi:septum site-determining protein MinC